MAHRIAAGVKKAGRGFANLAKGDFKDAGKFFKESVESNVKGLMTVSGLRAVGKFVKPEFPEIPVPETPDPVAIPETGGDALDALRRRKKRKGRASTIVTGSLIPEDVGTKSLLG